MAELSKVVLMTLVVMCCVSVPAPSDAGAQEESCWKCEDDEEENKHWLAWSQHIWERGWYDEPCGIHLTPDDGFCLFNHDAGCFDTEEDSEPRTEDLLALVAAAPSHGLGDLLEQHPDRLALSEDGRAIGFLDCEGILGFWYTLRDAQTVEGPG